MANLMPTGKQQYFNNAGVPLSGGKIYTFDVGTTTPKATYSDAAGVTPNANPVILNSRGEALIFWDGVYDVQVKDANDNLIYTVPNYSANNDAASVSYAGLSLASILKSYVGKVVSSISLLRALDKTKYTRAFVSGYYADGDGGGGPYYYDSSDTTSADNGGTVIVATDGGRWKLVIQSSISVKQFGAKGDWNGTTGTDDTAAIQRALDYAANTAWSNATAAINKGGLVVYFPPGDYRITDTLKVGASTALRGFGPVGGTAASVTNLTGARITCDFTGNLKRWAISSATYETASGTFAAFNRLYTGTEHDSGAITLTTGIEISGIVINGNGAYGGIRLLASSGFHVHDCMVYNVAVGYLFNTCYGAQYERIQTMHALYGVFLKACTAIVAGQTYSDKLYTTWTIDATTRLINTSDFGPTAYMPDWSNKTFGIYIEGCINMNMAGQVGEHADVGIAMSNVTNFTFGGYAESNVESNYGAVASSGSLNLLSNGTTGGTKYHYGVNNDITMDCCTMGAIYVGYPQNTVRVAGKNAMGSGSTDWTWNDAITFVDLKNTLRVSASGSSTAVFGYTTLDEALRRIGASTSRDWVISIKDGDTVATTAQRPFNDKNILFKREGSSTRPTISVGAAGGGFIYRSMIYGDIAITFSNVNVSFPTSVAGAAGDAALFLVNTNYSANIKLTFQSGNLSLGNAYNLFRVSSSAAARIDAAWADAGITATVAAPISSVGGSALVTSIAGGVTTDAAIKALGTNGWQGTVLSSNF